jgi:hypothetical protein
MTLTKSEVTKNYFKDFFHLPDDYPDRIAKYPDTQLKKSEVVKTRICYSCMCSIISGAAFAAPTHGGSAVVCVWAARRWYVAARKLKFIKAELTKRDIELRPFMHRDWIIPASIAITAASIGLGVELGLGFIIPIGQAGENGTITLADPGQLHPLHDALANSASSAPDPNLASSSHAEAAFSTTYGPNFTSAANEATNTVQGKSLAQQFFSGFGDQLQSFFESQHAIAGQTLEGTYQSAAAWVAGAHSAQIMEKQLAVLLGSQFVSMTCERLDTESLVPRSLRAPGLSCPRLPWATDIFCSNCDTQIQTGKFYHCCECREDDEELTLCLKCSDKTPTSHDSSHNLMLTQTALPGRVFLPSTAKAQVKTIAGPKSLSCSACGRVVTKGWYYDCWDCRKDSQTWAQCSACCTLGRSCHGTNAHSFYAFRRASFASYSENTPYRKPKNGSAETGQISCSVCAGLVSRGAYYHCSACRFDVCELCFAKDEHCNSNKHVLRRYYAWKYKRYVDCNLREKWQCGNSQCDFRDRNDAFFFSCREKACGQGGYQVCPSCYFEDHTCSENHEMFKCVWK